MPEEKKNLASEIPKTSEEEKITPDTQLQGALGNMRFKQAEPKMCHPPKIENGVNN